MQLKTLFAFLSAKAESVNIISEAEEKVLCEQIVCVMQSIQMTRRCVLRSQGKNRDKKKTREGEWTLRFEGEQISWIVQALTRL